MTGTVPQLRVRAKGFRGLVGFARRDITPPIGIRNRNWGAATSDVARGIHRPFTLSALAVASDDQSSPVLVAALDGTHWRRADDWEWLKSAALAALELTEDHLLVNLSHTHSGPVLCAAHADLPGGDLLPGYLAAMRDALVAAGRAAIDALGEGTIEWTTGRSDVAVNRDLDLDGRALVGYNPQLPADDTVLVGRVSRADGSALATVVNYACHPTTLAWKNESLSPDYVGQLRDTVEEQTGAPCMFLQGASGDISPRLQYSGDTSLADRHGRSIGLAVLAALEAMPPPGRDLVFAEAVESGAPLAVWATEPSDLPADIRLARRLVELPLRRLPTLDQLEQEWAGILPQSRDERLRRVRDLRENYIDLVRRPDSVDHPMWALRIGDAILLAHPGEAYNSLQTELRRRFPEMPVVVMNLTNGPGFVYLPDEQAYRRNAYQAWQTVFAPGALEKFTDAAYETLFNL